VGSRHHFVGSDVIDGSATFRAPVATANSKLIDTAIRYRNDERNPGMKTRSGRLRWARVMGFGALLLAMVIGGMGRSGRVAAQEATPVATGAAVVNVVGHGSATVEPDLATTSIGVTISNPSLSEAQSAATTTMNAIIDAIKEAGVDEKDIQTSYYSVNVVSNYDNMGNPTEVSGYQVSNVAQVIIRDIDAVGDILEAGVAAGANTIYGVTFGLADPKPAPASLLSPMRKRPLKSWPRHPDCHSDVCCRSAKVWSRQSPTLLTANSAEEKPAAGFRPEPWKSRSMSR
jgi:hypothetical protein